MKFKLKRRQKCFHYQTRRSKNKGVCKILCWRLLWKCRCTFSPTAYSVHSDTLWEYSDIIFDDFRFSHHGECDFCRIIPTTLFEGLTFLLILCFVAHLCEAGAEYFLRLVKTFILDPLLNDVALPVYNSHKATISWNTLTSWINK